MNKIPKAVFTRKGFTISAPGNPSGASPAELSWAAARVFRGDLAEEIGRLKSESGKPIMADGGAKFMRSLIHAKLIDESHLAIHPLALGAGQSIFGGVPMPRELKLVSVKDRPPRRQYHGSESTD